MTPHRIAHFTLIASGLFLVGSILLTIIGFMIFLSDPRQGPFDGYRLREISVGLLPYVGLTIAFFGAWLASSRGIRITLLLLYLLLGVYASVVGYVVWQSTGALLMLVAFPLLLLVSIPAFLVEQQTKHGRTDAST